MAAALAAAVLLGLAAASVKTDRTEEVADRFDLDPSKRADLQAATAYLYVRYGNAAVFRHLGGEGIDREQAAYAVLQAVRAKPYLLGRRGGRRAQRGAGRGAASHQGGGA